MAVTLEALVSDFKSLADPTRLRVLAVLKRGERTVKDLTEILVQSQPRISRHLKLLADAGLVARSQEGAWVYYRLPDDGLNLEVVEFAIRNLGPKDELLRRDQNRLDELIERRRMAADAYFAEYADEWDRIRDLHVPEVDVEAAMLEMVGSGPFRSLLDLGTGTGRMLELFSERCDRGIGIDRSAAMLAVARSNLEKGGLGHMRVRTGDVLDLAVPRNAFDLVVIHQVLHFLDDPARAIGEAASALSSSGTLLIVDFASHELEFLRDKYAHVRLGFSHSQIRQWIRASGLKMGAVQDLRGKSQSKSPLTVTIWVAVAGHKENQAFGAAR